MIYTDHEAIRLLFLGLKRFKDTQWHKPLKDCLWAMQGRYYRTHGEEWDLPLCA